MQTSFTYEGAKYDVDAEVCNSGANVIRLPDGRYLQVMSALESLPPQIGEVRLVEYTESMNVFEASASD